MTVRAARALLASLSPLVLFVALPGAAQIDGKKVFQDHKCTFCHSVDSEGISGGSLAKGMHIPWTDGCPDCTGDLSTAGDRRPDRKWLRAYLKNQKKGWNGLRHNEVPFTLDNSAEVLVLRGATSLQSELTDEEVDALVSWLVTLKKQKQ